MFLKLETHANWDLFRDFLFSVSAMTIKIAKIWRMLGKAKAAAEALAAEEVIAVPTDNIYGFAALVKNKQGVGKL